MANHNHSFFYFALIITALFHFLAIGPIASWISREILPSLSDESIEIDLSEIKARTTISHGNREIAEKIPEELPPESIKSDQTDQKKEQFLNPTDKKVLDPNLTEDRVLDPDQIQAPAPPDRAPPNRSRPPASPKKPNLKKIKSPLFLSKNLKLKTQRFQSPKKKKLSPRK